ncbi:MAG: aminotransferase class V-fold PLP-dependent enzyme [Mariprofundaceae bacterium]|nr:aminotransferase class V-fold PLP-dependent enzyme [Mariprofundaceae bacterium]
MMHDEFPLDETLIYLNHAAVSVWPRRTARAVHAFADENMHRGAVDYPGWLRVERELRGRLRSLLHAGSVDDIALLKNTSEGLSLVAYGLDWQRGDNIVSTNQEFPSNRIVWESLADRGVALRCADVSGDDPEEAIMALVDEHTRLMAVSSVQYGSGLRLDIKRLGKFCRAHGILFCVDAIQSLGAIRFDALACCADIVVADGHKWMMGPEGLAVFHTTPAVRDQLRLVQYGWHMVEHAGDFERRDWMPSASARRFEPGSPNMLGIHALNASLSLLLEEGMEAVEADVLARARQVMELTQAAKGMELLTPSEEGRFAGIVTFRCRGLNAAGHAVLYRQLMKEGVICAHRGGGIRFSPHYYTDPDAIERAWRMVVRLVSGLC